MSLDFLSASGGRMSSKVTIVGFAYVGSLVYGGVWGYKLASEAPVQTTAKKIGFTVAGIMLGPGIAFEKAAGAGIKAAQWMWNKNGGG